MDTLNDLFTRVSNLKVFLDSCPRTNNEPQISPLLNDFLESTLVATNIPSNPTLSSTCNFTQKEVVDRIIGALVSKSSKYSAKNALSLGFRKLTPGASSIPGLPGVESYFPNTIINHLTSRPWALLLDYIGESAMDWILFNLLVFIPLENNCYAQVAGTLLHEVQAKDQPSKRIDPTKKARSQYLDRNKMLYQHPRKSKTGAIIYGPSKKCILK